MEFVIIVVLVVVVAFVLASRAGRPKQATGSQKSKGAPWAYTPRESFLTRSETAFFRAVRGVLPDNHHAFPKVRLSDIVEIKASGRDYWSAFGRISQKHVDFVLCDSSFKPYLVVEVDGASHRRKKQQASDATKDEVLRVSGLPLVRYQVGTEWDLTRITEHLP